MFFQKEMKKITGNLLDIKNNLVKQIINEIFLHEETPLFSPSVYLKKEALEDTLKYIKEKMTLSKIMIFENRFQVLDYALKLVKKQGLLLEFGVCSGETINKIAKARPDSTIYGFDSFRGLPEDWAGRCVAKNDFQDNQLPEVEKNVILIKGWFNKTLTEFVKYHQGDIAFLHIDCGIYSSTVDVFKEVESKINEGTIILFDEYFNFPNWREHEFKAFKEFCERFDVKYEYLAIGYQQVAVRILSKGR